MGLRHVLTGLVVAGVAAVAVLAALLSRGGPDDAERGARAGSSLRGPLTPTAGALDGTLVVTAGDGCVLERLDLERVRLLEPGPRTGCEIAVSPLGDRAIVVSQRRGDDGLVSVSLYDLQGRPSRSADLGSSFGPPAWSPEAQRIAICRDGQTTEVVDLDGTTSSSVPGCWPAVDAGGTITMLAVAGRRPGALSAARLSSPSLDVGRPILSTPSQVVLRDGVEVLRLTDVLVAAGARRQSPGLLLGHAVAPDGTLAVEALFLTDSGVQTTVQQWDGGAMVRAIEVPPLTGKRGPADRVTESGTVGDLLRFSPTGDELAIVLRRGDGELIVLDARTGRVVLGPVEQHGFDWSADGTWLAISTGSEIQVFGTERSSTPTFTLPVAVSDLAWRPQR